MKIELFKSIQEKLTAKRFPLGIIGLGKSGNSAQKLLKLLEFKQGRDFFLFDDKHLSDYPNPEKFLNETQVRTLIVSPGVPLSTKWIQEFKYSGGLIFSELSLASLLLQNETCIGVTGSLGKSTTTSLIGHALKSLDPNTFVGGNLGTPLCQYFIDLLEGQRTDRTKYVVLELSSYQLENCEGLPLAYSAITYLSPNHLERYASLEEYYKTKWRIFTLTQKKVFLNCHGGDLVSFAEKSPDYRNKYQIVKTDSAGIRGIQFSQSPLVGKHNWENISLAAALIEKLGVPESTFRELFMFAGLPHRLQYLGFSNLRGMHFINDSKATAIESVISAMEAVTHDPRFRDHTIILLVGGRDKKLPWITLAKHLKKMKHVKVVLFGELKEIVQKVMSDFDLFPLASHSKLEDVFLTLQDIKTSRTVVLLSPGGTSLDEFENFEVRGQRFEFYCQKYFNDFKHV